MTNKFHSAKRMLPSVTSETHKSSKKLVTTRKLTTKPETTQSNSKMSELNGSTHFDWLSKITCEYPPELKNLTTMVNICLH